MKIFSYLLILLVCFGCLNGTKQLGGDIMLCAEKLMNEHPDSALILLKGIESQNRYGVQKAKYALLYSQALDKNSIDLITDSIIFPAKKILCRKRCVKRSCKNVLLSGPYLSKCE